MPPMLINQTRCSVEQLKIQTGGRSVPIMRRKVVLKTDVAYRTILTSKDVFCQCAYEITYLLGKKSGKRNHPHGRVMNYMQRIINKLMENQTQMDQILAENAIDSLPEYTDPKEIEISVTSPLVNSYIQIVQLIDGLVQRLDAMWLSNLIYRSEISKITEPWWNDILRLKRFVVLIVRKSSQQKNTAENLKDRLPAAGEPAEEREDAACATA